MILASLVSRLNGSAIRGFLTCALTILEAEIFGMCMGYDSLGYWKPWKETLVNWRLSHVLGQFA